MPASERRAATPQMTVHGRSSPIVLPRGANCCSMDDAANEKA
jgi:hypothetical protein